jgi:hypothetical protein
MTSNSCNRCVRFGGNPKSIILCSSQYLLRAMATVARYPLLWPDKPSVAISILTKLPNTLAEYPSTYKCRLCIRSAKTSVRPCISPAMTPVTGFILQLSYSNPCHRFRYYCSCHHKIQFTMRRFLLLWLWPAMRLLLSLQY